MLWKFEDQAYLWILIHGLRVSLVKNDQSDSRTTNIKMILMTTRI